MIRKVDTSGIISTIAGNFSQQNSGDGGPAREASIGIPSAVAADGDGNLYIVDPDFSVIRKVNPAGIISTLAGTGVGGFTGNGGLADTSELNGSYGLVLDPSGNVYVADYLNNAVRVITASSEPVAAAPTFSPAPGTYPSGEPIYLYDSTPGATIHYTLDDSAPLASSPGYGGPILIEDPTLLIRAIAIAPGYINSPMTAATYMSPHPPAARPTFSPAPGKYLGSVTVTISDTTPKSSIHFTLDGTTPLSSSPVYTGPITLTASTNVKAIATAPGYWKSAVVLAQYSVVPQTPTPAISPAPGLYKVGQMITITDAIPTATIRYTTDGSIPTPTSNWYHGPFTLTGSETIKAIAISTGRASSAVASATYSIQ